MTKTNPTTDGLVERLAAWIASPSLDGTETSGMFEVAFALEIRDALTASELLVTKLQNQLDSGGNSAVAESARRGPVAPTESNSLPVGKVD